MSVFARSVLLLCILAVASASKNVLFIPTQHTIVTINNTLVGNEDLKIHCKSKEDDLGVHVLKKHETFHWSFWISVFGNTQFFCSFQWGKSPLQYFDMYIENRDWLTCESCNWYIKENGPCRTEYDHLQCYHWN